ncbi:MAG: type IV toxin-antitoxin system AbiEi family antitoxin domain-containing protein [Rhodospirillales bacterium]
MGRPVVTPYEFFALIFEMHRSGNIKNLNLETEFPGKKTCRRLRMNLQKNNVISNDRDYGSGVIRVNAVSDRPAEDIVCLADPLCYVSHLSAMQRWGLTNRSPKALMMTRPDRRTISAWIKETVSRDFESSVDIVHRPKDTGHPARVRRREISVYQTKNYGRSIEVKGAFARVSNIGQTFLDMLQDPRFCGGMAHVIDVWDEHAKTHFEEIVKAVDRAQSRLVKSRAGYLLEERQGLSGKTVESWKTLGQRGGSRLLDPHREFAPKYSETWMISLNAG